MSLVEAEAEEERGGRSWKGREKERKGHFAMGKRRRERGVESAERKDGGTHTQLQERHDTEWLKKDHSSVCKI